MSVGQGAGDAPRGRFIVVEGVEGSGKTTQAGLLQAFLREARMEVVATREPGGTRVGERIRRLLLHGGDVPVPDETELLLILAARSAFVREVVEPALARGAWVVSERFDLSTFAYQGYGRGIDLRRIEPLNRVATSGLAPDLYIVLDVPAEEGLARQKLQGKGDDRFESAGTGFHRSVRRGYVELARTTDAAVLIPASGSPEAVAARIRGELASRFPETAVGGRVGPRARTDIAEETR